MTNQKSQSPQADLPLFYHHLVGVNPEQFKGYSLKLENGYGFAAGANAIPLNATEFVMACRSYPVVFSTGDKPMPLAITGVAAGENLYCGKDGQWQPGAYVPAYVRRYPFIFFEDHEHDQLLLCFDWVEALLEKGDQCPLFDAQGEATEAAQQAFEFCKMYQEHVVFTEQLVAALVAADLLAEHNAQLTIPGRGTVNLTGFNVVDEEKFSKLDITTLQDWRDKGWLAMIYAHLISFTNWQNLIRLASAEKV